MNGNNEPQGGFTLLEVIVALVILAVGFGAAFGQISDDARGAGSAVRNLKATALAESLLARAGHDIPIRSMPLEGNEISGFQWSIITTPVGEPPDPAIPHTLLPLQVSVAVTWKDGQQPRKISLTTVRLVRAE